MPYLGKSPNFGVRQRYTYTPNAGTTSISGADVNGATLSFSDGAFVDVYLNGVKLKAETDYVTTTANTIGSLTATIANDEVEVVVYDIFTVADMVSATGGGTFQGRVDFTGGIGGSGGNLVLKNTDTADDSFPTLTLQTGDTDIAVGDALGKINFQAPDEGADNDAVTVSASIQAVSEGDFSASNNATSVVIFTGESEAAESDGGGKYTFDSFGQLFLKNTTNADGSTPALRLETGDIDIEADDMLGRIMFSAPDEGAGTDAILTAAEIRATSEGDFANDNNATTLSFLTAASGGATESMSIDSVGAVAIGKGGVARNNFSGFQCVTVGGSAATTGSLLDLEDSSGNIDGRASGENGNLLLGADPGNATGSSKITFQVDGTERARIANTGLFEILANTNGLLGDLNNADGTSPVGVRINFTGADPNNVDNYFLSGEASGTVRIKLYSGGTVKNSTGTYTSFSDERLKSDIVDAKSQWEDIKALKFKNFIKYDNPGLKQLGLIAQDVEKTSASLVFESPPETSEVKHNSVFGTLYTKDDAETQDVLYTKDDQDVKDGKAQIGDIKTPSTKKIGDVKEVKENVKNLKDSILYMKSVKALQEAIIRIETLETSNADLIKRIKTLEEA